MPEETPVGTQPETPKQIGIIYHISHEQTRELKVFLENKGYVFSKCDSGLTYIRNRELVDNLHNIDGCLSFAWKRQGTRGLFLSVLDGDFGEIVLDWLDKNKK